MIMVMRWPRLRFLFLLSLTAAVGLLGNASCVSEHLLTRGDVEAMRFAPGPGLELLARATARRMGEVLEAAVQSRADASWRARVPTLVDSLNMSALEELHAGRSGGWWVTRHGEVTPAGEQLLATLAKVRHHRLDPARYNEVVIAEERAAIAAMAPDVNRLKNVVWPDPARARVRAWLVARAHAPEDIEVWVHEGMAAGVLGAAGDAWSRERSQELEALADRSWVLELTLSDALLTYAEDLRVHHEFDKTGPERMNGSLEEGWNGHESGVEKVRALTADLGRLEAGLASLAPAYPQYHRLLDAHARYKGYCAAGGWTTLRYSRPIRPGARGSTVQWLRERLHAEGHDVGDVESTERYGAPLREAVEAYQRTHQFKDDGVVDKRVLRSLNKSCERRLAQIGVTLDKWRESRILNPHGYFIQVNIPSFVGEVWDQGEVTHAFRVVVGNREVARKNGQRVYRWATPELSSRLRNLVFNPYWNVPLSIMTEDEILENHDADPLWAVEAHYEIVEDSGGRRTARQLPGPWNALGKVKFIFPNDYSVYLHDTPSKSKFRSPYRAYSHGCMRVENAMDLAQHLLERQGMWKRRYGKETRLDRWVALREPVPIYVTYFLTQVDSEGAVHFGADLYRRDAARIAAELKKITADAAPAP